MVRGKTRIAKGSKMTKLVSVMQELMAANDTKTIMQTARRYVLELLEADAVTILFRGKYECYYSDDNMTPSRWDGNNFPLDIFLSGLTMTDKRAITIGNIFLDDRISKTIHKPSFVKSLVMAPIHSSSPIGALGCYWSNEQLVNDDHVELVQSIADVMAIAIQNLNKRTSLERRLEDRITELEEANYSLEAFNHSISHDLRAPLRSLSGIAQMFQAVLISKIDKEDVELASKIVGSIDYMEQLIDGLLAFSKLGREKVLTTKVSMKEVVHEICDLVKAERDNHQVKFHIENLPDVEADPILIRQVWTNLIGNAVKYTGRQPSPCIRIGSRLQDDGVEFFIKDNGVGFNMTQADKLFKVFQRLHTQREFDGIGIGLSLVQRIITKHGGKVWAKGQVDKGATFFFSLPR